jgi:hypothetical protein
VPEDPSTLRKWAKAQNWSPWKEAQVRELARPLDCFTRVLLYLATVAGFKYIHDYVANKPQAPDKEILYATQLHITGEFFVPGIGGIGPDISRRVRPVLKGQIKGRRQYWSDLEAEVRTVTNNPRH